MAKNICGSPHLWYTGDGQIDMINSRKAWSVKNDSLLPMKLVKTFSYYMHQTALFIVLEITEYGF